MSFDFRNLGREWSEGFEYAIANRAQFADVAFAITAAASAEAASAAAAVSQAWSDLDRLDHDCSATMKVY